MIKTVEYKECTCDMCGKKEHIPTNRDMPEGWGWFRVCLNREVGDYHTCANCGERVASVLEKMKLVNDL